MNQTKCGGKLAKSLRAEAEAMVGSLSPEEAKAQPAEILLHELLVNKVELGMQNEELRRANIALEEARDRYIDLFEFAPIGYIAISREGLIVEINLTGSVLLGVDRSKLIKRRFSQFIAMQDKDRWYRLFLNMMEHPAEKHEFGLEMLRGEDMSFYAHLDCQVREAADAPAMLRVAVTDISQIKQAEKELLIAATAFQSQESIFVTDADIRIIKVNQAFTKITGYSAEESIGKNPHIFSSGLHDEAFYAAMWESINSTGMWQGEIWNRHKNGENYLGWLTITAVNGNDGEVLHYVSTLTDVTQLKADQEKIEQLAFYDPLTNLPNRRLLKDRLHLALAYSARSRQQGALLFIDLDNFKKLNDTLGHGTGDLLLQQVAQRLVSSVREGDTVARLGGDEFVVMLVNLGEHTEEAAIHAQITGKKLLTVLSQPYRFGEQNYRCTASIGATLFYDHRAAEDELLKHVDIAMYQAKHSGRNALCFFDQQMQLALIERAGIEADLHLALEQDQFTLHYQMQATHGGQFVGAEALMRWQHPGKGLISPARFIPVAEESGLILPIGQWALEAACAQLKKWAGQSSGSNLVVAVNVSARQFYEPDFVQQVLGTLDKFGVDPGKLKLELTETLVLHNIADTIRKMNALKDFGVSFSMDDFGTGYSSLSYLTQLPLDQLKIDQSFVHNIGIKASDAIIVQTIIAMTKTLGIEVIAEGVETEEQRVFLENNGCLLYQGYLFSKPMPLAEFETLFH